MTNVYRIEWTRYVPGGDHSRECSSVRGDMQTVRDYLDAQCVWGRGEPIIITEHTQSDGVGRIVPASEWDIDPEDV